MFPYIRVRFSWFHWQWIHRHNTAPSLLISILWSIFSINPPCTLGVFLTIINQLIHQTISNWEIMCLLGGLAQSNQTVGSIFRASRLAILTENMILIWLQFYIFCMLQNVSFVNESTTLYLNSPCTLGVLPTNKKTADAPEYVQLGNNVLIRWSSSI